jgi:hypothetical protein
MTGTICILYMGKICDGKKKFSRKIALDSGITNVRCRII